MTTPLKHILLVEDSQAEAILLQEAFKLFKCKAQIDILTYGREVMPFLNSRVSDPPDLIILDLKLPDIDGKEILRTLKSDPKLSRIPIVVRTGFSSEMEKLYCADLGVDGYWEKKDDINDIEIQLEEIKNLLCKSTVS